MADLRQIIAKAQRKTDRPLAVLVNNGDANSYGVVANLGSAGVSVLSVSPDKSNLTFRSRYAQAVLCPDFISEEESFIGFLTALGEMISPKPVLFTNGDEIALVLLKYRERLQVLFHMPFLPNHLAQQLTEKNAFYGLLAKHGIPHPRTWTTRSTADVKSIAAEIQYPCIVKPSQSQTFSATYGNKCLRADSAEQLVALCRKVSRTEPEIVIQEMLQGTERYLVYNYFSQSGEHKAVSCYRKERIFPIDFGNATACRSVISPELEELAGAMLEAVKFRGLGEVEIQRDSRDGKLKVIEVNIRSTTQSRLSPACGVNMEYIAYRDMLGEHQPFLANRKAGVLWVDLYRDALAVFGNGGYRSQTGFGFRQWLRGMRGKRVFAFCSLKDPLPALFLIVWVIRIHVISRLTRSGRT